MSDAAAQMSPMVLGAGWKLQDASLVPQAGEQVSAAGFRASDWYSATVPGTVLTTLVNNKVYPEPLYGENNRPEFIPDALARKQFWYRTTVDVPRSYAGRHVWLNFEGINYSAAIWVNGTQVGTLRGAFIRGRFDVSYNVKAGHKAVIAVLVSPQPNPGVPHEHTLREGLGKNGGITAADGPTFLSTIGWDWLPAIRDRDTGIWQKVTLSTSGDVLIHDPLVTTDLPLPRTDSTDIAVQATVENITDEAQTCVLRGSIAGIVFRKPVELAAHSRQVIRFDPNNTPALHMLNPKLWWPNGYGAQNLYSLHLAAEIQGRPSDTREVSFGVRKITYAVPDSENLTLSVNGVRVFVRGGNWGLDEAMKRIPRERLEAQIRMHQLANLNMIRNWVGQSTSEDFYELCDQYGLLLWDEFFQPNPSDGPNPADLATYIANVRDKILRFRNHPSIAVWCARNEGYPPKEIDDPLRVMMAELEPTRLYQPSSTDGRGVSSHGPYKWRTPREFYKITEAFKTETGTVSVPTLESVQGMMPQKDWETINDDWAEHDFARGASGSDEFPSILASRYGKIANLADFVRKSQMMNYESYRAMYEGRNAQMFHPTTGVLTWMSHPAQPSFVWQLYHYDLEPNSSLFAVKSASEPVHLQFNESTQELQVINNRPDALTSATALLTIYNLDGSQAARQSYPVTAPASSATSLGAVAFPVGLTPVHFLQLQLRDANATLLSANVYWHGSVDHPDDLTDLDAMPVAMLEAKVSRHDTATKTMLTVTLHNASRTPALMTHVQLRQGHSEERVLPAFYSDNYVSLMPDETRTVTVEADRKQWKEAAALIVVDGWNVRVEPVSAPGVALKINQNAQVDHWPKSGLPFQTERLR